MSTEIPAILCDETDMSEFPCPKCGDARLNLKPQPTYPVKRRGKVRCTDPDCASYDGPHAHNPIPDCARCCNTGVVLVKI